MIIVEDCGSHGGFCEGNDTLVARKKESFPVQNLSQLDEIKIYPNPAQDWLTIEGIKEDIITGIEIIAVSGETVKAKTFIMEKQTTISLESLKTGLYFLRLYTPQGIQLMKFVKTE